jgi:hypothetical protein
MCLFIYKITEDNYFELLSQKIDDKKKKIELENVEREKNAKKTQRNFVVILLT